MRIRDVCTTLLSVPLERPIADSTHVLNDIQWIVVEIITNKGMVGETEFKKVVVGRDARDISGIWQACYSHCEYIGQTGLAAWGIAAIEIALWDLLGKESGLPVCRLMGSCHEQVPIYGSGGWLSYSIDELLAEVDAYLRRGFTAVKMKVGGADLERDVERVREVRKLIGDGVRLMVDAHQASTSHQAICFARQVEEREIFWPEEPVSKNDLDVYCRVASSTDIPVATGQREYSLGAFGDFLVRQGATILQPDALRIGGFGQCMKVAHLADAFERPVAPHFYREIDIHMMATVHNGLYLEYFGWLDDLLVNPLQVTNGMAIVPTKPGMSFEFTPEAVREYRVS